MAVMTSNEASGMVRPSVGAMTNSAPCMFFLASAMFSEEGSASTKRVPGNLSNEALTEPPIPHPVSNQLSGDDIFSETISGIDSLSP